MVRRKLIKLNSLTRTGTLTDLAHVRSTLAFTNKKRTWKQMTFREHLRRSWSSSRRGRAMTPWIRTIRFLKLKLELQRLPNSSETKWTQTILKEANQKSTRWQVDPRVKLWKSMTLTAPKPRCVTSPEVIPAVTLPTTITMSLNKKENRSGAQTHSTLLTQSWTKTTSLMRLATFMAVSLLKCLTHPRISRVREAVFRQATLPALSVLLRDLVYLPMQKDAQSKWFLQV